MQLSKILQQRLIFTIKVILVAKYCKYSSECFFFPSRLNKYIPGAALMAGITVAKAKNSERQMELTVAIPTERTVDVIVKLPLVHMYTISEHFTLHYNTLGITF